MAMYQSQHMRNMTFTWLSVEITTLIFSRKHYSNCEKVFLYWRWNWYDCEILRRIKLFYDTHEDFEFLNDQFILRGTEPNSRRYSAKTTMVTTLNLARGHHNAQGQSHLWIAGHGQLFRLISRLISMSRLLTDVADLAGYDDLLRH